MKKVLIIIGAVFAGLALLAIVGSMLPSDEPQKVVIVTETQAPAAEPAAVEPAENTLTAEEQEVYDFVSVNYPKAARLFKNTCKVTDQESSDSEVADLQVIIDDATSFSKIAEKWADLDYQLGEVAELEEAFETYMVSVRRYYKNWLNGVSGGDIDACSRNAVLAELKAEKWAPRVEERLAELESNSY